MSADRPTTRAGHFVGGYATWQQVVDEMEHRGFVYSDATRSWHRRDGYRVAGAFALDWLTQFQRPTHDTETDAT